MLLLGLSVCPSFCVSPRTEKAPERPDFRLDGSFFTCLFALVTCRGVDFLSLLRREKEPTRDLRLFFFLDAAGIKCRLDLSAWMRVLGKPLTETAPGWLEWLRWVGPRRSNCLLCLKKTSPSFKGSALCCLWSSVCSSAVCPLTHSSPWVAPEQSRACDSRLACRQSTHSQIVNPMIQSGTRVFPAPVSSLLYTLGSANGEQMQGKGRPCQLHADKQPTTSLRSTPASGLWSLKKCCIRRWICLLAQCRWRSCFVLWKFMRTATIYTVLHWSKYFSVPLGITVITPQ